MGKFKFYKAVTFIFCLLTLFGLLALNASINQDLIISVKPILVEKCEELGIYTLADAQNYIIIFTTICFAFAFINAICGLNFAHKKMESVSFKRQANNIGNVHVNDEKEIKEMKKQAKKEKAQTIKEAIKKAKAEKKVKIAETENTVQTTVETPVANVTVESAQAKKINDLLKQMK